MRKLSRVLVFVLVIAMSITAFALTGCGKKGDVELRVFTMFGVGDDHNAPYQAAVDKFLKNNDNVSIEDMSLPGATNTYDTILNSKFADESIAPDVLYTFAPGRNAAFTEYLATIDEVKAKYPDLVKNVKMGFAPDAYTIPFKGITEGIQYDPQWFSEADFASYEAFIARCEAVNKTSPATTFDATAQKSGSAIANPLGEINYWANMILLQKMGNKIADVDMMNKAWLNANKADLAAAIEEIKTVFNRIGFTNSNDAYGNEKDAMWNGNRALTIDGSWNVLGFYGEPYGNKKIVNDTDATKGIKVRNIVTDGSQKYVLAGFTHGWMINKNVLKDEAKLKAAVEFIKTQLGDVQNYYDKTGGFYSMDVTYSSTEYKMAADFRNLMNIQGAKAVVPIDDKFDLTAAKNAFFDGVKSYLQGTEGMSGTKIVDNMIKAYEN